MIRLGVAGLLLIGAMARGDGKKPAPEQECQDDYDECTETCQVDHELDDSKKKLRKCLKKCSEDREECLDRYRESQKK